MSRMNAKNGLGDAGAEVVQRGPVWLGACLFLIVLTRLIHVSQPIVENYVGRQIPTAMVARNLERGSGFLHPHLDTLPAPNYFLVEPPVYQVSVRGLRWLTGWSLDSSGRLASAISTALAALALHGLIVRREGPHVAVAAVIALGILPVTLRYGRSFQPDAFSLGMTLLGVDCWDRSVQGGSCAWRIPGWFLLAVGLAAKVTSAFMLVPLCLVSFRGRSLLIRLTALSALIPAMLWYGWAYELLEDGGGSAASAENRSIWLRVVGFAALGQAETLGHIGRFLLIRSFTPIGIALACWGLFFTSAVNRQQKSGAADTVRLDFWKVHAVSCLLMLAMLAAKLHHEYYWLALSPAVAAGLGRSYARLSVRRAAIAWSLAGMFLVLSVGMSRSTYATPAEWKDLEEAALTVREVVPTNAWVVAPEPLLYLADRRGCRLEYTVDAARRAAREWREASPPIIEKPADLVEFYRSRGGRYFADIGAEDTDALRKGLHQVIRERYKVLVDRGSVMIAELKP